MQGSRSPRSEQSLLGCTKPVQRAASTAWCCVHESRSACAGPGRRWRTIPGAAAGSPSGDWFDLPTRHPDTGPGWLTRSAGMMNKPLRPAHH